MTKHADDCPSEPAVTELVEEYRVSPECLEEEFLAAVKLYAREVVAQHELSVTVGDLEWEVSHRAKRRAGAVKHIDGDPQAVNLAWKHFESQEWPAVAATVRHELIHVHLLNEDSDSTHGLDFQRLAEHLNTFIHCERFTDPKYWVICKDCDYQLARYRHSKVVKHPTRYQCSECGGPFRVEQDQ